MMQMFTSAREHPARRYCADCADTNTEVRAELAAAQSTRTLDMSDDSLEIEGETCEACQRLIS